MSKKLLVQKKRSPAAVSEELPRDKNMSHFGLGFGDEIMAKHVIYSSSVGNLPHKWPPVTLGSIV